MATDRTEGQALLVIYTRNGVWPQDKAEGTHRCTSECYQPDRGRDDYTEIENARSNRAICYITRCMVVPPTVFLLLESKVAIYAPDP